jgi:RimJ/RimL family protein N-acetyltransferase
MFAFALSETEALLPRTPLILQPYHDLLVANHERLARWEPWAEQPPVLAETRGFLEATARNWIAGSELPTAIAVRENDQWKLVGATGLRISGYTRSAEVGYWVDGGYEGRGLVSRAVAALLDHGFAHLGIERVGLNTDSSNQRSRALAERLGFVQEGLLRQARAFAHERRDQVVYGMLADEWRRRTA